MKNPKLYEAHDFIQSLENQGSFRNRTLIKTGRGMQPPAYFGFFGANICFYYGRNKELGRKKGRRGT